MRDMLFTSVYWKIKFPMLFFTCKNLPIIKQLWSSVDLRLPLNMFNICTYNWLQSPWKSFVKYMFRCGCLFLFFTDFIKRCSFRRQWQIGGELLPRSEVEANCVSRWSGWHKWVDSRQLSAVPCRDSNLAFSYDLAMCGFRGVAYVQLKSPIYR